MTARKTADSRRTTNHSFDSAAVENFEDVSVEDFEERGERGVLLRATKVCGEANDPELRSDDESPSDLQRVWRKGASR
jgi:hypothetical protein